MVEAGVVYFLLLAYPSRRLGLDLKQFDLLTIAVPLVLLVLLRRSFRDYGLTLGDWRDGLRVALTSYLPVSLALLPTVFVDWASWSGAAVLGASYLAALAIVAWLFHRPLVPVMGVVTIVLTVAGMGAVAFAHGTLPPAPKALDSFVTYALFVAVAEEVFWRGYVQSRLNLAFGRPYRAGGIMWGPGLIVASVFFGFVHVLNIDPATGSVGWYWPWGAWNVCAGLLYGYVREKTGSVLASTVLHGLPAGIGRALGP